VGDEVVNELHELGLTTTSRSFFISPFTVRSAQPTIRIIYSGDPSLSTINLSGDTAHWVIEAAKKLEALARFRKGWDSYGGLPLKQRAKDLTLRVLGWLRKDELPVPAVVLGSGGTVQLEWRTRGKELEIELRDNDSIEFVKVNPDGEIEEEGEAENDLSSRLHDLTAWLLHS
jgi:hypothetical protein